MQGTCSTIFSMAPPLEKSYPFASREQRQEAWAPHLQSSSPAAATGPDVLLGKCPVAGTWWNSYRSPVNVHSDSSSSDDESSSEKEEERNVQLEDPRMTKPRAPLLGKWDSGDSKAGPCNGSCLGVQFHANAHNGDLLGNSQQITDVGEIQNVCLKCGKSFSKKSTLKRHVKIHSNEKPHQCSICSKRFIERGNLNKHLRIHTTRPHSEKKPYKCPECGERFSTVLSYATHRRMHASELTYQCPECERSYTAERHLVKHLMKAHLGANVYKCSSCEKGFLDEMDLVQHQRMAHKRDRFYQCLDCGKSYKAKSSLNKHQRIHMRECKMSFRDHQSPARQWRMQGKEELYTSLTYKVDSVKSPAHVMPQESNTEDRIHMCPDCGKCFKDERCFDDHQTIHTRDQQYQCPSEGSFKEGTPLSPNQIAQEDPNCNQWCDGVQPLSTGSTLALRPVTTMEENLHICPDCGKVFKGNQYFANHLRSHTQEKQSMNCSQGGMLPAGQQETQPKSGAHRCPTCKRVYSNVHNLRRHQREHSECSPSKNANQREDVALQNSFTERQKAQTEGRPHQHKCSYCGKEFRAKYLLNKHRKTHLEGKPYECTDCGKTLAYEHIFSHYREVHGEAQLCPYKCAHCGKAFQTPSSLRRHQQMHTEGKPYRCSICGKGFAFRDALAHHQEIHTLMQHRVHICLFCGKTFPTNDSLNRHKRIHMGTRSYQCSICEKAFGTKYSLRRHLEMHAKRSPGHSSNGGKDPGSSSALAKDPSSDTEENSNNWSDSSTLSGHQEVHLEGKTPDCMNDSDLSEPQEAPLGKCSAKRLSFERAFREGSEPPEDQASHAGGHFNNLCDSSVCSGHWEVHMEENPLERAECGGRSALPGPQSAHSEENSTEWLEGDKTVTAGSVLINGQLGHTEENLNELTENSVFLGQQGALVEDNAPECSENGAAFLASSTPIKHQGAHREENSVRGSGGEKFIKDNSPKSGHQKTIVQKKLHICSECGKSFKYNYALKRHSKVHSVVRPYLCQKCNKTFVLSSDLTRHETTHTDLRPYQCPECGKCFKRKSTVHKHQISHKGEKPYCCSYCDKRVTTKSGLDRHVQIHTRERPFKCTKCGKSFARQSTLKKHLQKHLNAAEVSSVDWLNQTS